MKPVPISAFMDNYIWALVDETSGLFTCVDPGDASPVLHFAHSSQLKPGAILLTHHHQDHIGGVSELIKAYPSCAVYGPQDARIPYVNHFVAAHQTIQIGPYHFTILFTPGHTATHISYYETQHQWLFCGDTLFSAGCGRVFDGTLEQLHQSLQLLQTLPMTTQIFCAHEYTQQNLRFAQTVEPSNACIQQQLQKLQHHTVSCSLPSTLALEKSINPFLRLDEPEVQQYALKHGATSKNTLELFRILRAQKNAFI